MIALATASIFNEEIGELGQNIRDILNIK